MTNQEIIEYEAQCSFCQDIKIVRPIVEKNKQYDICFDCFKQQLNFILGSLVEHFSEKV